MTDDLLRRAAAALREESRPSDDGARFTRARVMSSLQQSQVRRRSRAALLLPIAACLAAATAWGTVSGKTTALWQTVAESIGLKTDDAPAPSHKASPPSKPRRSGSQELKRKPAPLEVGATAPSAPAETTPSPLAEPEPAAAPPVAAPAMSGGLSPSTGNTRAQRSHELPRPSASEAAVNGLEPASDAAHELYRTAHRLHFVTHDSAAALRAWDAYLSAAPNGRFALEARYNRAVCLVRLGRNLEARQALEPFADGQFGGYRKDESRALLDALEN